MKRFGNIKALLVVFVVLVITASCGSDKTLRNSSFDRNWKFQKGTVVGAETPDFDDALWRTLDLPHDWSVEPLLSHAAPEDSDMADTSVVIGPFCNSSIGKEATGQTVGGEGWYRKHFTIAKGDSEKRHILYFEGAYNQSEVWVNGIKVGDNVYGYSSFRCDITEACRPAGEENVVAVCVKNIGKNTRWYAGSGIYRHVWLINTSNVHLDVWETFVEADSLDNNGDAFISIDTKIFNREDQQYNVVVDVNITDMGGVDVAIIKGEPVSIAGNDNVELSFSGVIKTPNLWSPDSPTRYIAKFILKDDNSNELDCITVPFGVRTIEFSSEQGFLLNGQPTLLYGGCIHHDNGLLGAAAYDCAEERKVQLLKDNGYNAVRCSHNPPSPHFLDACDSIGIMVIDEAFDCWHLKKNKQDYHQYFDEHAQSDLQTMVRRDRNHPSIIMWSIGNEIRERNDDDGVAIAQNLRSWIHELDKSRPITAGINNCWMPDRTTRISPAKAFSYQDVAGANYMWSYYEVDRQDMPNLILYGSETVACELARSWTKTEGLPYVIGDFQWTALDYLGEAGIGSAIEIDAEENVHFFQPWPWYNGWCGDIDLLGVKKPQSYFRDVVWRRSDITMGVVSPITSGKKSHVSFWGWPNERPIWDAAVGDTMTVNVYARSEKVRLYLNNELFGEDTVSQTTFSASFKVPYVEGTLRAEVINQNPTDKFSSKNGASCQITTPGEPTHLRFSPTKTELTANNVDLTWVLIELVDDNNNVVYDSSREISYTIEGPADVIASGNGSPNDMESFRSSTPKFYNGRAMLVIKSTDNKGRIIVKVNSENISGSELELTAR